MAEETRDTILNAAEKEFSSNGFDGARVDKIAKKAGVNKALIYYYFKSKKELLKALYERLVKKGFSAFDYSTLTSDDSPENEEKTHSSMHEIIQFLETHRDIIRILFMESLKEDGQNMLLDLADFYLDDATKGLSSVLDESTDFNALDKKQWMMTEVFTALIPMISYTLFKGDIQKRLSVSDEDMDHYFMKSLKETHFQTHKSFLNNTKENKE
ncbi:TetR/AcrR family transcriptional regulator [Oceanispirochaeta sp.]|jgi:TetR/AcrR family transcriptional regulator|uniref:TetR/AcrR family transcriptional regulator n=1 Tax=Oceanispirochaeta sp. TaxID=2035350 RepID=UPI00262C6E20|nr:TetR/AcrR family transcriptional regulator [Oceanispirochaeta sp.]MDA3956682.1 TetR/AcrR family transcriptional regulator [Oceanispirochaeta sp.]